MVIVLEDINILDLLISYHIQLKLIFGYKC